MKKIVFFVFIFIVFISTEKLSFSQNETSIQNNYRINIENVLQQDAFTYGPMNLKITSKMYLINTEGCPSEFRAAYLDYIYSQETYNNEISNLMIQLTREESIDEVIFDVIGASVETAGRVIVNDNPFYVIDQSREKSRTQGQKFEDAKTQVQKNFQTLRKIAIEYGVTMAIPTHGGSFYPIIQEISPGSLAENYGFLINDKILSYGGVETAQLTNNNLNKFQELVASKKDSEVFVTINRGVLSKNIKILIRSNESFGIKYVLQK